MQAGPWSWLEVAKLVASLSMPVAVLVLGLMLERRKVANQELTKKRITVFDKVAPRLNDMYCFYRVVGHWRALDPDKIIAGKREIDREMHVYRALFSAELFTAYMEFMRSCFMMYGGAGHSAKLRLDVDYARREMGAGWNESWLAGIDAMAPSSAADVTARYDALMHAFSREIGVDG